MLDNKKAFVTGGGSGIGLAIAKALGEAGAEVTVAGRNADKLARTGLSFVEMDVTDETSVRDAAESIAGADIFIACAGAAATAPALKTKTETWRHMLAVNLTSVYLCSQVALPAMIDRGWGRFIAIASTASLRAYPYTGAYAAAKHGVLGWVKTLALEIAKTGVTANAICPGFTDTPLIDDAVQKIVEKTGRSPEDAKKAFTGDNPMGRLIQPSEVADAALWLAGDAAASVNGQAIVIDGGELCG